MNMNKTFSIDSSTEKKLAAPTDYLSDHGENDYDELGCLDREYKGVMPKSNAKIPFVLWMTHNNKKAPPDKISAISADSNKPSVSDDLFHAILDIYGIESSLFDNIRSVFSHSYIHARKRKLIDAEDYDRI